MSSAKTHRSDRPARYPLRAAVLLAVAAAVLRLAVILWRQGHDPLFHQPINDAAIYDQWARALLAGQPFGLPGAPYFLPPLYPFFVAVLFKLGSGSLWMVTVIQALLGTGTVLGIHRLGFKLHGGKAGLLAGALALMCAPALWYEGWLLPTVLNLFLLTVVLNLMVELLEPRPRSLLFALGLGLTLGLAAVNRPQNLLLAVLVLAWLWWLDRGKPRPRWRTVGMVLAALVITFAPVTLRNLRVSGEPVLLSANGGVNFYIANHAGADGRFSFPSGFPAYIGQMQEASRQMASAEAGRDLNWRQTSAHWFAKGGKDLADNPVRALKLELLKARLLVSWREMENNFVVGWVQERSGPGRLLIPSLGLYWLLAAPALVAALRRRNPRDLVLLIPMLATMAVCLVFWVSTRNRLPLLIPLAVLGGASLAGPLPWKQPRNLLVVVLLALAVFWPTADREGAGFLCDIGRIHAQQGDIDRARAVFGEALILEPDYPMALNGMALTYMDEGRPDQAIALLEDLLRKHPDFDLARRNLQAIRNYQKNQR